MRNALIKDNRLRAVFELLGEAPLVADVGCDHGCLSAALITGGRAKTVIASDVSAHSVRKAAALAKRLGIEDRMKTVLADGLSPLDGAEPPYSIAICGMGGELIARILERGRTIALFADKIVMQPMRGEAELRKYLVENGYGITDERIAVDSGRYYQVISAAPGRENAIPEGFPKDFFRFGWIMAEKRDPALPALLERYKAAYLRELKRAEIKGRTPESIVEEIERTEELIRFVTDN